MQIEIGDQPLFDDSLLRLWLNAEQYHTDPDKAAAWAGLEKALGQDNQKAIIMSQLRSKVIALQAIEDLVLTIVGKGSV